MRIRLAKAADAEVLAHNNVSLAKESEDEDLKFSTVLSGVRAVLSDPSKGFYLVAEHGGAVVGQLMITFEWSDWRNKAIWWVQSVYVGPSWRKMGVFTKLLNDVERRAQKEDVVLLRLYVHTSNNKAMAVYRKSMMFKEEYNIFCKKIK